MKITYLGLNRLKKLDLLTFSPVWGVLAGNTLVITLERVFEDWI